MFAHVIMGGIISETLATVCTHVFLLYILGVKLDFFSRNLAFCVAIIMVADS
jgi:hypothetical protein